MKHSRPVVTPAFAISYLAMLVLANWASIQAWVSLGRRPRYNSPEPWATAVWREHNFLYGVSEIIYVLLMWASPLVVAWSVVDLVHRHRRNVCARLAAVWLAVLLLSLLLIVLDPFGAVGWYFD